METLINVQEYIQLIDRKFFEAKKKRISRFDTEWGIWSRDMNLEIRKKVGKCKDSGEIAMLNSILPYWLITSELVELHHKSRILGTSKKKKLARERRDIKDDILGGNAISEISIKELAARAFRGDGK